MADTIRTLPTDQRITHHLSLSQGATKLGLILCNGRGDPDPTAMPQGKMPNRALQFSQGDPDYSDMELPYTPITQKDWSGGRGNEDFENDKTRYSDSQNIDASKGEIILGPKSTSATYATPPTDITNTQNASANFPNPYPDPAGDYYVSLNESNEYVDGVAWASRFQWTNTVPLDKVKVKLANVSKVTVIIFKYNTVDFSTWLHRDYFRQAAMGWVPVGSSVDGGAITTVALQTFDIVEQPTLTEYEFNLPTNLVLNNYYVISVMGIFYNDPAMVYPQSEGFTIKPLFGLNTTSSSADFRGIRGNFSWRQEGGSSGESNTFYECNDVGGFYSLAYTLTPSINDPGAAHFFTLRNTKFVVVSPSTGAAPRLFMEGYHGYAAGSNASNKTQILARNIGSEVVGANCKLISGPGSTELVRWREISSVVTGASGYCVVDPAWNITHSVDTEFAIFGTGKWIEITGHGLTTTITDVMVVNDIVFFCQGEDVGIRRMTFYKNTGTSPYTWSPKYWTETAKASYLEMIQDEKGVQKIWRALATTAKVSSSSVAAWADAADILSFGTEIICGNQMYRITNIVAYGNPRIPFIMKEDGFGSINNSIYDQIPLTEFAAVADDNNGRAALQRGVYLFLSMLNGTERYYEGRLDDMGPNRDLGLPNDRNGRISHLIAYPGRMYAAIDHPTGYSSILAHNDIGWHEIYRSSLGARIYSMDVQVIDGDKCDRMWVAHEGSITWFPVTIDPKKQDDYSFASSGNIETSWISGNFREINKYFSSILIFSEGLSANQYAQISYKVDSDDNDWTIISTLVTQSPSQEINFPGHNITGKKIKIKISLYTSNSLYTPRIKAITIKPVTRLPIKKSWTLTYKVDDNLFDLQGEKSTLTAAQIQAQLETWSSSESTPSPLYMEHPHEMYNGKYVFIEPESIRPIEWVKDSNNNIVAIGQLSVFEAD